MKQDINAVFEELTRQKEIDGFFKGCDTNGDEVVNILDIKAFLCLRFTEEDNIHLIIPFVKQIKKLFKTDFIDKMTLEKVFSTKFQTITNLRDYRGTMLKLRDMANNDSTKITMKKVFYHYQDTY